MPRYSPPKSWYYLKKQRQRRNALSTGVGGAPDVYDYLFAGTLGSTFTVGNTQINLHRIAAANMSKKPPSGSTKIKLVVQGNIVAAAVAIAATTGDPYDAAAAYTSMTFGGAAGVSGKAATDLTESDPANFAWNGTSDLLVGLVINASGSFSYTNAAGTGKALYVKSGAASVANDLTTVDKTGYAASGNALWGLQSVLTNGFEPLF